jgi:hypothetical protein
MMVPLNEPEGEHITIDLPYFAVVEFCANVPTQMDDSKNSFPLHVTIRTQPMILPVRDESAVEFCYGVRKSEGGHASVMPSSTTKRVHCARAPRLGMMQRQPHRSRKQ